MYIKELSISVIYRFRFFPDVVCDAEKQFWQLDCCPKKRTIPTRKLTYNDKKKAFRIRGIWVTKNRLLKLYYPVNEKIVLVKEEIAPF